MGIHVPGPLRSNKSGRSSKTTGIEAKIALAVDNNVLDQVCLTSLALGMTWSLYGLIIFCLAMKVDCRSVSATTTVIGPNSLSDGEFDMGVDRAVNT